MQLTCLIAFISFSVGLPQLDAQQTFPEWRGSNTLTHGVWIASSIAAVGEVTNVRSYGVQDSKNLPWPMSPEVHKLYWREGDFRATAIVKGESGPAAKTYLWASSLPGCKLWDNDPGLIYSRFKSRVWLLREEGEFLRPPFDSGTVRFIGLLTKWDESARLPARRQLGTLLLTPAANSDTLKDYAHYLWYVGDIACELLGKAECVRQIKALAKMGSPILRENACNFLKGQMDEPCLPK
jgi:hypothetical protein